MAITVRYFAAVREQLGAEERWSWGDADDNPPETVGALLVWLQGRSPAHAQALGRAGLRMALNQDMCEADAALTDGAEVAFFPPVTGG